MLGLHIVADFYGCRGERVYLTDATVLRGVCLQVIAKRGLTIIGDRFHQFEGGGVTGCVVLAESHLAIHTWPELGSLTLDIYVCNYSQDNSQKAKQVANDLLLIFQPADCEHQDILRGGPDRRDSPLRTFSKDSSTRKTAIAALITEPA